MQAYIVSGNPISGKINAIDLSKLRLIEGARTLDVGCARGYSMVEFGKLGCLVHGVEVLPSLTWEAAQTLRKNDISGFPLTGSAMALPYEDATFDAVICTEVIEHVPSAEHVLAEIYRVLKPGGCLCIAMPTWFTERLFNYLDHNFATYSGHVRIFGPGEIQNLLKQQGFKILEKQGYYVEWSLYWLIRSLFLKTEPVFYEEARQYKHLDYIYKRSWRIADRLEIGKAIKAIGNHLFPKSHYFYCSKPDYAHRPR